MRTKNTIIQKSRKFILSMFMLSLAFSVRAQIKAPDMLHLSFNDDISSTGKIKNLASDASKYADSAVVYGFKLSNGGACGRAILGNGGKSDQNRVETNMVVDLNESWTIAFWVDGLASKGAHYLFSSVGWNGFRCFTNGAAGDSNILVRQSSGMNLLIEGVADHEDHEVVLVHDRKNKVVKAYKDRKFQSEHTYQDSLVQSYSTRDVFVVAGYGTSNSLPAGALMDEFRIYSYAIDTTRISAFSLDGVRLNYNVSGCGNTATAPNGVTFNKSGTYYDTLLGSGNECDTILTYNVELFPSYKDTTRVNGCGTYTLNGSTYTKNTTISDTLKTINGCDSIIVTDIMIYPLSLDTQKVNSCGFYVNNTGDTLRTSTSYYDTFINQNGCDSVIYMVVNITTINRGITSANNTLTADEMNGTYKWLDCDADYAEIAGETAQSFTPTINGSYAVEVTVESCTDTSDCVTISGLSLTGITKNDFVIAPNPNNGIFTIKSLTNELFTTSILDVNGKECQFKSQKSSNVWSIDMSDLPNGIYFINIIGERSSSQVKVIKDR